MTGEATLGGGVGPFFAGTWWGVTFPTFWCFRGLGLVFFDQGEVHAVKTRQSKIEPCIRRLGISNDAAEGSYPPRNGEIAPAEERVIKSQPIVPDNTPLG
jgi:hypothetical protein